MLFHASVPANDPERVARVIAELWRGESLSFPAYSGAYIAWAGDDRGTVLDVVPRALEHLPADGQFAAQTNPNPPRYSAAHLAIGTVLSVEETLAIAEREGWFAQRSQRGGLFDVVEFWIENQFLLELLPVAEQQQYVKNLTLENLRSLSERRD
jgi:hypothetical protein